jgi:predicted HTH transcriptional regulator
MSNWMSMITLDQILAAAQIGETDDWEFKSAKGGLPANFWDTYSAMANTDGGAVVLGVSQKEDAFRLDGYGAKTYLLVVHRRRHRNSHSEFYSCTWLSASPTHF